MQNRKGETEHPIEPSDPPAPEERRRVAKVSHDERGNARVEWSRAPQHGERTPLSLEEGPPGSSPERGYDPYQKAARTAHNKPADPKGDRRSTRDLRRLSDWIKRMRELEERKRRGEPDEDG